MRLLFGRVRPAVHARLPSREFLETAPDVRVRVRGGVVAVEVERAVALSLAVVAADAQHNARGVVVAVVADVGILAACDRRRVQCVLEAGNARDLV